MKRQQAFKFQFLPNGQQARDMRRFAGACRFFFNKSLALQNDNHDARNRYIPYVKMASWLVEWKSEPATQWLKEAPYNRCSMRSEIWREPIKTFSSNELHFRDSKNADKVTPFAIRRG